MGKGSTRRREDTEKIWSNWDAIFKKDKKEEEPKQEQPDKDAPKENAK